MAWSQKTTGVTVDSYKRFLIDAGAVFLNYGEVDEVELGTTRGGNTFVVEQELRDMEADGLPGPTMGFRRIVSVTPSIQANMLELGVDVLKLALPGSDSRDFDLNLAGTDPYDTEDVGFDKTHDSIFRDRTVAITDYVKNVTIVGQILGQEGRAALQIKNGISSENLSLGLTQNDEAVQVLNIQGHFDPASFDETGKSEEPWEIFWPVEPVEPE